MLSDICNLLGQRKTYFLHLHVHVFLCLGLHFSYTCVSYPGLFGNLETIVNDDGVTTAQSLGIASYGVSMTTLEEVFMKIGKRTFCRFQVLKSSMR